MKHLKTIAAAALIAFPALALAQTDQSQPAASSPPMMSPDMMQSMKQMLQSCAMMMQATRSQTGDTSAMQGDMGQMLTQESMQSDMHHMHGQTSEASTAMMDAMAKMDAPMMDAIQSSDPDIAFVKAMIPHHQGAIDMARAILQYGKDEQVKTWANEIIAAQEKEIGEMEEWLKAHGEQAP